MKYTLDALPSELLEYILEHLPTALAITNVARTCRKLYEVVTKGESTIWHHFLQRQFPTIDIDPPYGKAAFDLTSRSRAFDRRAFIARECVPPRLDGDNAVANLRGHHHMGFMPVIDSYERMTEGNNCEVLAWGAAGRLRVRTRRGKEVKWSTYSIEDDVAPHTDILDLHLLRPHQNRNRFGESVLIRRANRELVLMHAMPEADNWVVSSAYKAKTETAIDCLDISRSSNPLLAVCESKSIQLFSVHNGQKQSRADHVVPLETVSTTKQRKRSAKFMTENKLAVSSQHLEGLQQAIIEVFDVSAARASTTPVAALESFSADRKGPVGRIGANVLATINHNVPSANGGTNLLLSGWSDGLVRVHDLRVGSSPVRTFADPVDDGQIFSILPIGQERFLAGSHQNACLKIFDMRMGGQVYDYRRARNMTLSSPKSPTNIGPAPRLNPAATTFVPSGSFIPDLSQLSIARPLPPRSSRGTNIFLALTVHRATQPWQPLPGRQNNARLPRYRGSIYSLSSPSPSSRTVYAGIENHVIQLDFVNTDDLVDNRGGLAEVLDDRPVLNLSCYERPRMGYESTDTVLLRKQLDIDDRSRGSVRSEPGWDERWQLEQQRSRRGMAASWWQGRP